MFFKICGYSDNGAQTDRYMMKKIIKVIRSKISIVFQIFKFSKRDGIFSKEASIQAK